MPDQAMLNRATQTKRHFAINRKTYNAVYRATMRDGASHDHANAILANN